MKLGLFLNVSNPPAWHQPWPDVYARVLQLVVDAEDAGIDAVWATEHHGFEDGYLPQPLTLLAALAARTSRIRLGTAITVAGLRHPRHVAEEAALVDILSAGRLELGIGAGYVQSEFDAFGVDRDKRMDLADDAVREIRRLWSAGEVMPPPFQDEVPTWMGYMGPRGARRAGRLGTGLLSLDRRLLEPYHQGLAEAGHSLDTARMGGVMDIIVTRDPDAAAHRLAPHVAHHLNAYRKALFAGGPDEQPSLVSADQLLSGRADTGRLGGFHVVTADHAVDVIRRQTEGLPVEHVYTWAAVGGMPDDMVVEHVELLTTLVRPALVDAQPTKA